MTGTNDKLRGLILAALMVTSVFAGTIAFTGSAAAAANAPDGYVKITDGTVIFAGQDTYWDATGNTSGEYTLQKYTGDNNWQFVRKLTVNSTGAYIPVDTSGLEGQYRIHSADDTVNVEFEVAVQSLSAEFDPAKVTHTGDETLTLESNDNDYQVEVTANGGLDETDLSSIFSGADIASTSSDDDSITINVSDTSQDFPSPLTRTRFRLVTTTSRSQ
ncbi:surface glycoprotein [Halobacteriaceae archaeon GCM10025711]